jgi:hypothetical protein
MSSAASRRPSASRACGSSWRCTTPKTGGSTPTGAGSSTPPIRGTPGSTGSRTTLDGGINHKEFFKQARPSKRFVETWKDKILEVIDNYDPDMLWFDFGLSGMPEKPKAEFLAYCYTKAIERGKEVVVTYKDYDLPPGSGVVDLELGRMDKLTYNEVDPMIWLENLLHTYVRVEDTVVITQNGC